MANQLETILQRDINSVSDLKKAIKELQDSLVGLDTSSEEYRTTSVKLNAAQDALRNTTRSGIEANLAAKDSLVGLKAEYKSLYDQYKQLTEAQRNSDFGKNMAESLENLSNKINDTQKGVGAFKDNIGRYAQDVTDAFNGMGVSVGALKGPLDAATNSTKGLNTAFSLISKHPILMALSAIVLVLVKAAAAIKDNEELTMRLHQAMSVFKPVLDAVSNAFDFLAGVLVRVVEGLSKVAEKILSIVPGMGAAIKSHKELAKATDELTKKQRENSVVLSQKQSEVETLRAEAAAATDANEKQRLLQEAKTMQMEIDQEYINMAQKELRIMEEYAAKTANNTEANDKLAAAQKKVNDAIAAGQKHQKEYNEQIKTTTQAIKSQTSTGKNYREEARKLYDQLVEDSKNEITKLTEKYEKEKKLLEKYHLDTKLLTKKYNTELAAINEKNRLEANKKWLDANQQRLTAEQRHNAALRALQRDELQKRMDVLKDLQKELITLSSAWTLYNVDVLPEDLAEADEKLRPVLDMVQRLNTEYGITIRNITDLTDQEKLAEKEIEDISGLISMRTTENFDKFYAEMGATNAINYYKAFSYKLDEYSKGERGDYFGQFASNAEVASGILSGAVSEEYVMLEKRAELLEEELQNDQLTTDQRIQLLQAYADTEEEIYNRHEALRTLDRERTAEMVENLTSMTDSIGNALGNIRGSYDTLIDSQLKAGQIDEKEATKRKKRLLALQKVETAFNIATIVADAASGIFSIWKGYATETGTVNPQTAAATGPAAAATLAALNTKSLVSAIAKTTSLAATATAQIMAARNGVVAAKNNFNAENGGGSTSVAATPVLISSEPYTYTRTVQTAEEEDAINQRPIVCSIVDIEDALETRKVRVQETTF